MMSLSKGVVSSIQEFFGHVLKTLFDNTLLWILEEFFGLSYMDSINYCVDRTI